MDTKTQQPQGQPQRDHHIRELEKKISALSDALAELGRGTTLQELLKIIRFPGYTTPAEFAFNIGMLDAMHGQAMLIERLGHDLLDGAKQIVGQGAA
ncbi:hypothetical protein HSX11_18855 [Oxalobacteraceae bacterium]|nr:hypothetical protein [Oxalobacteraceae bacterium]